jgi:hypothetical protein
VNNHEYDQDEEALHLMDDAICARLRFMLAQKKASMMLAYQTSDTAGCAHLLIYRKPIVALCFRHRSYEAVFLKI